MACACKDTNGKQVYSKCAGQNGGPGTQSIGARWCCTNKIPVKDVCGDRCLDSDSWCGGKVKDNDEFKHDEDLNPTSNDTNDTNDTKDVKAIKIKESKLINIIKTTINRVMVESKHSGSYMAKKQLWGIAEKAQEMAERLQDNTQLEDWMESHIAKADSMMDSVYDSFDYDNQMDTPELFPGTMDALDSLTIRENKKALNEKWDCGSWENGWITCEDNEYCKEVGNEKSCHPMSGGKVGTRGTGTRGTGTRGVRYGRKGVREQDEIVALHNQDTSYRDQETGAVVASTQMLDRMDMKLDNLSNKVDDIYDNLSRRWN